MVTRYGRKRMMMIYHGVKTVGAAICFINNYVPFVIGRFMMACGSTGSSLAGYILGKNFEKIIVYEVNIAYVI